jgi:sulfoxide reductase heme-binding subunit YedZ
MIALKAPWNERNGKLSLLKLVVFISLFAPAAWIAYQWTAGLLGPKPVLEALHTTGQWAVRFTLLSLLVTPLRRVAGWPRLIALRRMLGLSAFSYALAHFCIYIGPDQDFAPLHAAAEIVSHFNLTIGFVALLGLSALAATSTDAMIKRMGALRWNRFHKQIYFIAALAIVHFYLQSKDIASESMLMMGLYFILMIDRVLQKLGWPAWAVAMGAAVTASFATALLEATNYALVRHIDFWSALGANIDFNNGLRPAAYVAAAGAALVILQSARSSRNGVFSRLFAGAK